MIDLFIFKLPDGFSADTSVKPSIYKKRGVVVTPTHPSDFKVVAGKLVLTKEMKT